MLIKTSRFHLPILAGLAVIFPLSLSAQTDETETTTSNMQVFVPEDFEQFAPRTAEDMVSQIPGFRIRGGGDGSRGFGQADGNVLINGQRLTSKSTSVEDALKRIPAANVERFELVDGATLDIPGLSGQVVNVIAKADGISGTWTYRQRYLQDVEAALDWLELAVNGQSGTLGWTVNFESQPQRGGGSGRENIFQGDLDLDGELDLFEVREEKQRFIGSRVNLSGALNWTPISGSIGNFNARYEVFDADNREASQRFSPDLEQFRSTLFNFTENEWNSEISGDYEFDLGPGRLKLIGLQRNEHSPFTNRFIGRDLDGGNFVQEQFDQVVDENESILRSEYSWSGKNKSDWQVSLEGAFNSLESDSKFQELDANNELAFTELDDPIITIEEKRAEMFLTHGRQLASKLRLQGSIGVEQSEIKSDGANSQVRSFVRPKGSVSLAWQASDKLTINTVLERDVGQLNFFDFVSSVDLDDGDDQSGNIDIVPEQSWDLSVEFERDFGDWGATTLELGASLLEDIIDQVPIGTGEGPGNLETGTRYSIDIDGTLKFDPIGLDGLQLTYSGAYNWSDVEDPITLESRRINASRIWFARLRLRHDVPNTDWAWGAWYQPFGRAPDFRQDTRLQFDASPGFALLFIEHKDVFGLTANAFFGNVVDSEDNFERITFSPDRNGVIDRIEDRSRQSGRTLTLRLRGTF